MIATNVVLEGIPPKLQSWLSLAIEKSKTEAHFGINQSYNIDDFMQLINLEILHLIKFQKKRIRRCRNCGKYFILNDLKRVYCDRKDESGRTCSDIGSKLSFKEKKENDPALKLYNSAYKTHHARYKHGKLNKEELNVWREQAKKKLNKVKNGYLTLEEYQKWLKK